MQHEGGQACGARSVGLPDKPRRCRGPQRSLCGRRVTVRLLSGMGRTAERPTQRSEAAACGAVAGRARSARLVQGSSELIQERLKLGRVGHQRSGPLA